jgi:hypothetical protein
VQDQQVEHGLSGLGERSSSAAISPEKLLLPAETRPRVVHQAELVVSVALIQDLDLTFVLTSAGGEPTELPGDGSSLAQFSAVCREGVKITDVDRDDGEGPHREGGNEQEVGDDGDAGQDDGNDSRQDVAAEQADARQETTMPTMRCTQPTSSDRGRGRQFAHTTHSSLTMAMKPWMAFIIREDHHERREEDP